jgi:hypothetical protein
MQLAYVIAAKMQKSFSLMCLFSNDYYTDSQMKRYAAFTAI